MRFAEMQRRVFAVIRDEHKRFIHDDEVEDWLNEGQEQIASRTRLFTDRITQASAGAAQFTDGVLDLPANFSDLGELTLGTDEDSVEFIASDQFNNKKRQTVYLNRAIGRIFAGKIEVFPDPGDDADYTLEYIKTGDDLSDPEAESTLPFGLQMAMVNFARYQAKLKEGELEEADRYFADFEAALERGHGDGRRHEMPSSIGYEPGPFDFEGSHRG